MTRRPPARNRPPRPVDPSDVFVFGHIVDIATGDVPDSDLPDHPTPREVRKHVDGPALSKAEAASALMILATFSRAFALSLPEAERDRVGLAIRDSLASGRACIDGHYVEPPS